MRLECTSCKGTIMIIRSGSYSPVGTDQIKHVHVYGCLNSHCDMFEQEISRTELEIESFQE